MLHQEGLGEGAREGQDEKRDRRAEKEVRGNMGRACRGEQKGVASREEGLRTQAEALE